MCSQAQWRLLQQENVSVLLSQVCVVSVIALSVLLAFELTFRMLFFNL